MCIKGAYCIFVERTKLPKNLNQSKRFTLIGIMALKNVSVMCIIIIEGKTPNSAIEAGIDFAVIPTGKP